VTSVYESTLVVDIYIRSPPGSRIIRLISACNAYQVDFLLKLTWLRSVLKGFVCESNAASFTNVLWVRALDDCLSR